MSDTAIVIAGVVTSLWLGWYLWSDSEIQRKADRGELK